MLTLSSFWPSSRSLRVDEWTSHPWEVPELERPAVARFWDKGWERRSHGGSRREDGVANERG